MAIVNNIAYTGTRTGTSEFVDFRKKLDEDGEDVDVLRRPDTMRIREFFVKHYTFGWNEIRYRRNGNDLGGFNREMIA